VAAAVAGAVALGVTACGGDDGTDAGAAPGTTSAITAPTTSTAPLDPGRAYVRALEEATSAMAGVATAVLDPRADPGTRAPRIESELRRLEVAATAMDALALEDAAVDAERRELVAAIPPFAEAMRSVVEAGREDRVNGGLELVQGREPILAGYRATLAADSGAVRAFGEDARAALEEARQALQRQVEDLRAQAAG
jgi:hypothetical protein